MQSKMIQGAAIVALLGAGAMAQDARPQGDKPMPKAEKPMTAMPAGVFCHKASDVIGSKVRNAQNAEIGKVEDLVVDPASGRIEYVALSLKDRTGNQWYAVPFQTLAMPASMDKMPPGEKTDGKHNMKDAKPEFTLNADAARLQSAPGFPKDKWPDINGPAWRSEVDTHFGDARGGNSGDTIAEHHAVRASELLERDLFTPANEKLGGIDELAIDPRNGRVAYAVVSTGGFLGLGDKLHAIPWEAIRATPASADGKDGKDKLVADLSKDRLMKAPEFKNSEWARMSDRTWVSELYGYYGVRPYWSDADDRAGKSGTPKEPKEKAKGEPRPKPDGQNPH